MVSKSELIAPKTGLDAEGWPYHKLEWAAVRSGKFLTGHRRLDAETFLSAGHDLRLSIEARAGWCRLSERATVWQPARLRGVQVSPENGTPFLAATQVFDMRPVPRKWLALGRTEDAQRRFVSEGMILVTCSGSVGRATIAFEPHLNTLISHDLLRVEPKSPREWGWLYAYLRASHTRSIMTGAKYGHIIKHLEVAHLNSLPVPMVDDAVLDHFASAARTLLQLRTSSHLAALEAEKIFEDAVGGSIQVPTGEDGFTAKLTDLAAGRRRFEASFHQPAVRAIYRRLESAGLKFVTLEEAGYDAWLPSRFRRIPASGGVELVDSSSLFEVNPDTDRRIADGDFGDRTNGRVHPGWLLLARSGQVYGINGNLVLASVALKGKVVTDDVIRLAPRPGAVRAGYALTALSHSVLGRPLVKALAYGSSIPHIDVSDIQKLRLARLKPLTEDDIADFAEGAAELRGRADLLENQIASEAEEILERFIASR